MSKYALYSRVSTKNQSVEDQVEDLEEWVEYKNYDFEHFKDKGVSAVDERPAFKEMMNRIDEFNGVAITTLSRFGRSVNQLSKWAEKLEEKDKDLVILDQNIDTSTKEGRLLFNILSSIAEFERELIRERMDKGYQKAYEEGRVGRNRKSVNLQRLKKMYKDGASYEYMSNKLGVSKDTIWRRLKEMDQIEEKRGEDT